MGLKAIDKRVQEVICKGDEIWKTMRTTFVVTLRKN